MKKPANVSLILFLLFWIPTASCLASIVEYNLDIGYKTVNITGIDVKAMALNDSIPGPTLRFREGDIARIRFKNSMDVATSVHWHGILLPYRQDGVPYVSNPPIEPGETKKFEFTIRQSGTYWFHSHTGLQEQRGVYGSIVITPERVSSDQDKVIVLSDWTKDSWYPTIIGTAQSHMTDGVAVFSNSKNILSTTWQVGWQRVDQTDYDVELAYDRYFNRFFNLFAGVNLTNDYERGILGIRYLLPFNIESTLRLDSEGELRIELAQEFQLTNRFGIFGDIEYDSESKEEWLLGGKYALSKNIALTGQYHSDFGAGAGLEFRY